MNVLNINLTLYLQIVTGCRIASFISTIITVSWAAEHFFENRNLSLLGAEEAMGIKCLLWPYFIGT